MAALKWGPRLWIEVNSYAWDDSGCFINSDSRRGWLVRDGDYWSLDWEPPDPPEPPNNVYPLLDWSVIRGGTLLADEKTVVKDRRFVIVPADHPLKKADVQKV